MNQPPSQTVNPPAVSRPTGTPCIIREPGCPSNISNCTGDTPFG